jgi:hypothetical protein
MGKKRKTSGPKNIDELEQTYYGPEKNGLNIDAEKLRRYEERMQAEIIAPSYEEKVKGIFSKLGKINKIPENSNGKTFDFEMPDEKILVEVTSLNSFTSPGKITVDPIEKTERAVSHIVEKNASDFPDYLKGGVIFYDIILDFATNFSKRIQQELPSSVVPRVKELDYLVFAPQNASINGKSSTLLYPIVVYLKNMGECIRFKKIYNGHEVICKKI